MHDRRERHTWRVCHSDKWTNGQKDKWTKGQKKGKRTNGQMDGQTDGNMDTKREIERLSFDTQAGRQKNKHTNVCKC